MHGIRLSPAGKQEEPLHILSFLGVSGKGLGLLGLLLRGISICIFCRAQSFVYFPFLGGKNSMNSGEG